MRKLEASLKIGRLQFEGVRVAEGCAYRRAVTNDDDDGGGSTATIRKYFNVALWHPPPKNIKFYKTTAEQTERAERDDYWDASSSSSSSSSSPSSVASDDNKLHNDDEEQDALSFSEEEVRDAGAAISSADLERNEDGQYFKWIEIPTECIGQLIGKAGVNIKQLQRDTSTKIFIESSSDDARRSTSTNDGAAAERSRVRVCGKTKTGVERCLVYIRDQYGILKTAVQPRFEWTHFVMIPLNDGGDFSELVAAWHQKLLDSDKTKFLGGEPERVLIPPKKLHLTVCVLRLTSEEKLQKAITVFESLQSKIYEALETRTVICNFQGLDILSETADDSRIAVARPEMTSDAARRLSQVAKTVIETLLKQGVLSEEEALRQRLIGSDTTSTAKVQFHATLLNAKYSRGGKVDVANIIKSFRLLPLGSSVLRRLVFASLRSGGTAAARSRRDGVYPSLAQIRFP